MFNSLAYALRPAGSGRRASPRCLRRDRRGTAAVEFAMILPVLVISLYLLFELGRGLWTANLLQLSVEEAGRFAAANPTATAGQITAVAEGMTTILRSGTVTFTVTSEPGPTDRLRYVGVRANLDFTLLFPLFRQEDGTAPLTTVPLSAMARMPVIQ